MKDIITGFLVTAFFLSLSCGMDHDVDVEGEVEIEIEGDLVLAVEQRICTEEYGYVSVSDKRRCSDSFVDWMRHATRSGGEAGSDRDSADRRDLLRGTPLVGVRDRWQDVHVAGPEE